MKLTSWPGAALCALAMMLINAPALASGALDGKRFDGVFMERGKTSGDADTLTFRGLSGAEPIEYVAFARGQRCCNFCEPVVVAGSARAQAIQVAKVRPDDLNNLAIAIAKAALAAVDHEADEDVPIDMDRYCHYVIYPDGAVVVVE